MSLAKRPNRKQRQHLRNVARALTRNAQNYTDGKINWESFKYSQTRLWDLAYPDNREKFVLTNSRNYFWSFYVLAHLRFAKRSALALVIRERGC